MRDAEFLDQRLVEVYDAECPWSRDDDFFLSLVEETPRVRVLDLGCGTGRLTLALSAAGHRVTGVDPAPASIAAARAKPGAEHVTWLEGTAADLPRAAYDVVVMTSHVAQFLVDDAAWLTTLDDVARALVPGGRLVFDSRDPHDRAWERWNPVDSRRRVTLVDGAHADGADVDVWTEVTSVAGGSVAFTHHYRFPDGAPLSSESTLRFRSEGELRSSLAAAGFVVERVYGGWGREPVGAGDGELLVVARTWGDKPPR